MIKEAGAHGVVTPLTLLHQWMSTTRPSLLLSPLRHRNFPLSSVFFPSSSTIRVVDVFFSLQETPARTEKRAGAQKTAHQEAAKRLHALHERDACECGGRMHAEGERCHQSDSGTKGRYTDPIFFVTVVYLC